MQLHVHVHTHTDWGRWPSQRSSIKSALHQVGSCPEKAGIWHTSRLPMSRTFNKSPTSSVAAAFLTLASQCLEAGPPGAHSTRETQCGRAWQFGARLAGPLETSHTHRQVMMDRRVRRRMFSTVCSPQRSRRASEGRKVISRRMQRGGRLLTVQRGV